jgi:hypothetical protein
LERAVRGAQSGHGGVALDIVAEDADVHTGMAEI